MNFETYPFEKLDRLLEPVEPNSQYVPLSLTIGEPQFQTPQFILDTLNDHASLLNKYPKTAGEAVLREGILTYLKNRFLLNLDNNQMIPTFGTREVLFNFPQFLLHDIKEPLMVFPNPFYQIYEGAAKASCANVVYLNLNETGRFQPIVDEEVLSKANLVVLNSPNNPTASVMSMDEMRLWVELALKYDFVLLNDECYADLYLDKPIPSLLNASIEAGNPNFKNVLVINSISKRSSAPGLRSGFIAGDATILKAYMVYRTYVGCASPLPLQYAAATAWADQKHVDGFRKKYKKNFEVAKEVLGIEAPEATFYIWLKVENEIDYTVTLYEQYNLKVIPGSFLGREGNGEGYVRLALVYEEEKTREALERIALLDQTLKSER
ncbi:MAG: succinyldiaminopimelate transaminase [Sulfurovum sp.]|nr:succinyldiaminopimelate transaminase [Sulfurovum sp.]MCB4744559.1 succinyldiaminopimelate transaminase [Sulfurovum sp.]MCB4746267.1 succinyldiaminopimelate transaminase [Sulfurovum sp.]MCB4749355.1 succinyldiaminopimelate transaminase [Sulfurovum sp.]MCB4751105.1 succinyldiaminopimelate transaminase [Sulfurovum sp.]